MCFFITDTRAKQFKAVTRLYHSITEIDAYLQNHPAGDKKSTILQEVKTIIQPNSCYDNPEQYTAIKKLIKDYFATLNTPRNCWHKISISADHPVTASARIITKVQLALATLQENSKDNSDPRDSIDHFILGNPQSID